MQVLHRDIKSANILLHYPDHTRKELESLGDFKALPLSGIQIATKQVTPQYQVKLADFGFSKLLPDGELDSQQCGTPLNMAPEILNGKDYNYKVDMWSIGVSLFEALFGTPPFFGTDKNDLTKNIN